MVGLVGWLVSASEGGWLVEGWAVGFFGWWVVGWYRDGK